ncbi:MAG: hypothetical protein ACI9HK_003750, partial [Pirellulaceae bacterium]
MATNSTRRPLPVGIVCVCLSLSTLLVATACLVSPEFVGTLAADESDNLDDQLLGDLEGDLLQGLEDLPGDEGQDKKPAIDKKSLGQKLLGQKLLDQKLLGELDGGEDLGDEKDPLKLIAQRMRSVEQLIGEQDTSENTQDLQKLIVSDLSTLIEALNKK